MLGSSEIRPTAPDFTAAPTPGAPATTKSSLLSVPREQSSTSRSASATGRSWPRPVASLLCRHRHLRLHRYCHRHHHHRVRDLAIIHKEVGQSINHFHCISSIRKWGRHCGHISHIQLPMHCAGTATCSFVLSFLYPLRNQRVYQFCWNINKWPKKRYTLLWELSKKLTSLPIAILFLGHSSHSSWASFLQTSSSVGVSFSCKHVSITWCFLVSDWFVWRVSSQNLHALQKARDRDAGVLLTTTHAIRAKTKLSGIFRTRLWLHPFLAVPSFAHWHRPGGLALPMPCRLPLRRHCPPVHPSGTGSSLRQGKSSVIRRNDNGLTKMI